jgi:hypothetical protein
VPGLAPTSLRSPSVCIRRIVTEPFRARIYQTQETGLLWFRLSSDAPSFPFNKQPIDAYGLPQSPSQGHAPGSHGQSKGLFCSPRPKKAFGSLNRDLINWRRKSVAGGSGLSESEFECSYSAMLRQDSSKVSDASTSTLHHSLLATSPSV